LVDDSSSQERILVKNEELENRRQALTQALSDLNVRERRIFEARRLAEDPIPLGELAEEFGISGERVRQIEVSCLRKGAKGGQTSSCHHRAARTLASQTSSFTWGFRAPREQTQAWTGNKSPAAEVSVAHRIN
jgi:hypothetical protein